MFHKLHKVNTLRFITRTAEEENRQHQEKVDTLRQPVFWRRQKKFGFFFFLVTLLSNKYISDNITDNLLEQTVRGLWLREETFISVSFDVHTTWAFY